MAAARTPARSSCLVSRSAPRRVRQNTIVGPAAGTSSAVTSARCRTVDAPEHVVRAAAVGLGAAGLVTHRRRAGSSRVEHVDRAVERRREQQRLARLGRLVEQAPHLGQEAHVGHAVGFVDDDDLDVVELERALAEQVGEAAGAGDEHVDAAVERAALRLVADAAVDGGDACGRTRRASGSSSRQICAVSSRVGARIERGRLALLRACRCGRRSGTPNAMVLPEPVGRAAADVAAREGVGDGRGLDVEGFGDPALGEHGDEVVRARRDRRSWKTRGILFSC